MWNKLHKLTLSELPELKFAISLDEQKQTNKQKEK